MQLAPLYQELFLPAFARNENKRREDLRDCASETKEREREREREIARASICYRGALARWASQRYQNETQDLPEWDISL